MPKLRPLWTPRSSGGSAGGLPAGFPAVVNGRLERAATYFNDFYTVSCAASGVGSEWTVTQAGSGAGTFGLGSSSTNIAGVFSLTTGATANDSIIAEPSLRAASANTFLNVSATTGDSGGFTFMVRGSWGTTRTACSHGWGLIETGIANGTLWCVDPDTVLGAGASRSLIIHRDADAYAGGNAGDVTARLYDGTGTDQTLVMLAAGSVTSAPAKFEFHRPQGSQTIFCYTEGVLVGTLTTSTASASMRPSFQTQTDGASARTINLDAMLIEYQIIPPAR